MGLFSTLFNREKVNYRKMVKEGAKLIDVRTPAEFKGGHVKGSLNKPLDNLSNWSKKLKSTDKVVLVCRSGARAGMAKRQLKNLGIEAYNAGAWQNLN